MADTNNDIHNNTLPPSKHSHKRSKKHSTHQPDEFKREEPSTSFVGQAEVTENNPENSSTSERTTNTAPLNSETLDIAQPCASPELVAAAAQPSDQITGKDSTVVGTYSETNKLTLDTQPSNNETSTTLHTDTEDSLSTDINGTCNTYNSSEVPESVQISDPPTVDTLPIITVDTPPIATVDTAQITTVDTPPIATVETPPITTVDMLPITTVDTPPITTVAPKRNSNPACESRTISPVLANFLSITPQTLNGEALHAVIQHAQTEAVIVIRKTDKTCSLRLERQHSHTRRHSEQTLSVPLSPITPIRTKEPLTPTCPPAIDRQNSHTRHHSHERERHKHHHHRRRRPEASPCDTTGEDGQLASEPSSGQLMPLETGSIRSRSLSAVSDPESAKTSPRASPSRAKKEKEKEKAPRPADSEEPEMACLAVESAPTTKSSDFDLSDDLPLVTSYFGKSESGAHSLQIPGVTQIAAHGTRAAAFLTRDGEVLCLPNGPPGCELTSKNSECDPIIIAALEPMIFVACATIYIAAISKSHKLYFCADLIKHPVMKYHELDDVEEVHVGSGELFAMARCKNGTLWAWGCGSGSVTRATVPTRVIFKLPPPPKPEFPMDEPDTESAEPEQAAVEPILIKTFDCGDAHAAAVTEKGDVWVWGYNSRLSLLKGSNENVITSPQLALAGQNIVNVACGRNVTYAVSEDGKVWFWGDPGNHIIHPTVATSGFMGYQTPSTLACLPRGATICCGVNHYAATTKDGDLWTWGSSESCRLGYEEELVYSDSLVHDQPPRCVALRVQQVACGSSYTLLLHRPSKRSRQLINAVTLAGRARQSQEARTTEEAQDRDSKGTSDRENAILKFNSSPLKGVSMLIEKGIIANSPKAVASFLRSCPDLNNFSVGDFLGSEGSEPILWEFLLLLDFSKLNFEMALRRFLWSHNLPGESQKIDRLMDAFARRYLSSAAENGAFKNKDSVYTLAFSCIMLNTSLHNPQSITKFSLSQWISSNEALNEGTDFPKDFLEYLYYQLLDCAFEFFSPGSLAVIMQGMLTVEKFISRTVKCTLDGSTFCADRTKIPLASLTQVKQQGSSLIIKYKPKNKPKTFTAKTTYTAEMWLRAFRAACPTLKDAV